MSNQVSAKEGKKILTRRIVLLSGLGARFAVIAYRRGADEDSGWVARLPDRLDNVRRTFDSTAAEDFFIRGRPATIGDTCTGEIHNRIASIDCRLPRTWLGRIVLDAMRSFS